MAKGRVTPEKKTLWHNFLISVLTISLEPFVNSPIAFVNRTNYSPRTKAGLGPTCKCWFVFIFTIHYIYQVPLLSVINLNQVTKVRVPSQPSEDLFVEKSKKALQFQYSVYMGKIL